MQYCVINNKKNIQSDYLNENIYNLLDQTFRIPENYSYNIFTVTHEYIARPDLISYDAYGDTMYGDVICKLNGVSNPFELNEGMKLIIPSPEYIKDFTIFPSIMDGDDYWGSNTNLDIQSKHAKRQPNEAIVGDVRFKIDPITGIIIY